MNRLLLAVCLVGYATGAYITPFVRSSLARRHLRHAEAVAVASEEAAPASDVEEPKRGMPKRRGRAKRTERKRPVGSTKGFGTTGTGLKFSRAPNAAANCACDAGIPYGECCLPCHEGAAAPDALALLRARYCAFCYRQPDYLMSTTKEGSPEWQDDPTAWKKGLLAFCDRFVFEGLTIVGQPILGESESEITFSVSLVEKGSIKMMVSTERSKFVKSEDGHWLYESGEVTYDNPN